MCAVFFFIWFSVNVCCFSLLLVTNLLINCEDTLSTHLFPNNILILFDVSLWSDDMSCKIHNQLFFFNLEVARKGGWCCFLHVIFYPTRWNMVGSLIPPMGHQFLTPWCLRVPQFYLQIIWPLRSLAA